MATTKQDLVDLICTKQEGMTKKAATELLDAVFDKITEAIKADQKFTFPGFGTFEIRTRRARTGVNPRNPSEELVFQALMHLRRTSASPPARR